MFVDYAFGAFNHLQCGVPCNGSIVWLDHYSVVETKCTAGGFTSFATNSLVFSYSLGIAIFKKYFLLAIHVNSRHGSNE